jgi:hypothetical protein
MGHELKDIFNIRAQLKSNDKSNEFRLKGNEYFKDGKNYYLSIVNYNMAIAYAKSKHTAALAYGNRSASYFEFKLYEDCLQNIQWARENGYPQNNMAKLNDREARCIEAMKESMDVDSENLWDFFKLSYPPNKNVPWIVDRVEVRWTEKYGRGIYAKEDLKAGDIIAVEETMFHHLDEENAVRRCYNCFKTNAMNLIPCDYTASIMFCSDICKKKFYGRALYNEEIVCADIKLLSNIVEPFGSVENFDNFMQQVDIKELNKTIFDYDLNNPEDPEYKKNMVMCLLSLSTNDRQIEFDCKIRKKISKKAAEHILSIYNLNFWLPLLDNGAGHSFNCGTQLPLFTSLINYSCVRNAFAFLADNKQVTVIQKPIKAGEQIFLCHPNPGIHFMYFHVKSGLEENWKFTCDCELCHNDDFLDINTMMFFLETLDERNFGSYKEFDKAREYLKEAFKELNTKPFTLKGFSTHMLRTGLILQAIAYYLSLPLRLKDPNFP